MSLQLAELREAIEPFPADKNVRVKITGLALCTFAAAQSTVEFLRHVKHHDLLMKITKVRSDMPDPNPKTITVKIEPTQNVEISATGMTPVDSHIHPPANANQDLGFLIGMRSLHDNIPLEDKRNMPARRPTLLRLNHCAFYTHKLTDGEYQFEDVDETPHPRPQQRYCQILAGYMSYSGNLEISIETDGIPLTFPLTGFLYEIEFSNSCDSTPECRDEEDFRFIYDVVKQTENPGRVFKLIEVPRATGTGACLPVCKTC